MVDDGIWKRRFMLFMGTRVLGLVLFLAGLAIGFTKAVKAGGIPAVGIVLIVIGAIGMAVAPKLMTNRWKTQDLAAGSPEAADGTDQ